MDGTAQRYVYDIPITQADTWTRIVKKIPGNSNLTFDNNTSVGLQVLFVPYYGTNYTNDKALNSWATTDGANYCPDMTTTWFTTNDATFDVTGVQIEVGSQATPFEHRSFGEELSLCQRYYYRMQNGSSGSYWVGHVTSYGGNNNMLMIYLPVCMRDNPTLGTSTTASHFQLWGNGTVENLASVPTLRSSVAINPQVVAIDISHNITTGESRILRMGSESHMEFATELQTMAYPTNPIYKLKNDSITGELNCILKVEGATQLSIPIAEGNTDYQTYLAWVADGNTAEASD